MILHKKRNNEEVIIMSSELRKIIATRITVARERAGLTQNQLATLLGVQRPSISEIESGNRKVSAEELVALADIFEVDVNWLAARGETTDDVLRDKLQLAARNIASLKPEDIDKVINLLQSLKPKTEE